MGALLGHRGLLLGADPDAAIRRAFAGGEDGIWISPRLGGMFQDSALATPWTSDGQPVGGYVDRSPNGHVGTQPTSTARPTGYSDRLVGDGADDFLDFGDILDLHTGGYFAVCIAKFATGAAGQALFGKADGTSTDGRYLVNRNGAGQLQTYIDTGAVRGTTVADTDTSLRVLSTIVDRPGGLITLRKNGVVAGTTNAGSEGLDFNTTLPYRIMAQGGPIQFFQGDFHELVAVLRTPAAGEIEAIEARLAEVHGITL